MSEVTKTINQHAEKDYNYAYEVEPMCQFCNSSVCRTKRIWYW